MKQPRVVIDESKWPRVYATWPGEQLSDDAFEQMAKAFSALSKRGQRYVIIHDARLAVRPTPNQRAIAAKYQKLDAELSKRFIVGTAIVVSSTLAAGALTAINWLAPPPFPQKVFSKVADAEKWATEQLAKHA